MNTQKGSLEQKRKTPNGGGERSGFHQFPNFGNKHVK